MTTEAPKNPLVATLARLRAAGVVPGIAGRLEPESARIAAELRDVVVKEVPAYTESGNPDVLPELGIHLAAVTAEAVRLLGAARHADFAFVAEHARRQAEQRFPLDAVHRAYRHAGRRLLERVRDAALAAANADAQVPRVVADITEFMLEYLGTITTLMTSGYVEQTRLVAEAEGDRRTELLRTLLEGYDESDGRAARVLRSAGYLEQRQSYCVAVARSVNPQEMEDVGRAQRMVDAISEVFNTTPIRHLAGVRDKLVVVVLSGARRLSGWTRPHTVLAERVYPRLRLVGPAALIGLSSDVPSTSHVPRATAEAKLALDCADVANRVMRYAEIPFRRVLLAHVGDKLGPALPAWADDFATADVRSRGALLETLKAYADADMNVQKAARALNVHPNTLYARMQKISDLTGRNALEYHALTELLLANDVRR
jgi:hypothetical protein